MKSLYPRHPQQLADHLAKNPVVNCRTPSIDCQLTFKNYDGLRLDFTDAEGHLITIPVSSALGHIEYNEDGFTRTVNLVTSWYYYTGPKPWQTTKPEWKKKIEDWDCVFDGLKGFVD